MDQKVEIKEEPVWLEGTSSRSFGNDELASEMMYLKEETKSLVTEPGQTQPAADIKDEIFIEEHTVDDLASCFREGNNVENVAALTKCPLHSCDGCCKTTERRCKLKYHLLTHTLDRPYLCTTPKSTYSQEESTKLQSVTECEEEPSSGNEYVKSFCGESDLSKQMLAIQPHYCTECGKSFSRKSHLKEHQLSHSGERPHCCNVCFKSFHSKSSLKAHLLSHSIERPFRCNVCNKAFSRKCHFNEHQLSHSQDRPFRCNECDSTFSRKSNLITHLLTHSGQRQFLCNLCNKTFFRKYHLKNHMMTHSKERPFVCNVCNSTFSRKFRLKEHQFSYHSGGRS